MYFTGTQGCLEGFVEYSADSRCYYVSNDKLTFFNTKTQCRAKTNNQGMMAEIRDSGSYKFVKPKLTGMRATGIIS